VNQEQPCQYLTWDSDFFGVRIAQVNGHTLDNQRIDHITAWCSQNQIDCLYFLAACDHFETTRLAEENGFHQVDIRLTLQRDLTDEDASFSMPPFSPAQIRPAKSEELPALITIARSSYELSRFFFDPCFSRQASAALYEEWIRKSIQGYADIVLAAKDERGVIGYISGNLPAADSPTDSPGEIGLVGIAAEARGQGIGTTLILRLLDWYRQRKVDRVNVITQGRNIAAQKLYQKTGFLTYSTQLWYHKWLAGCKAGRIHK
jgi:dTDP-4-amino-4,6-dideoxy-D-galactose acyltransferase